MQILPVLGPNLKPSSQLTIPICKQESFQCFWNKNKNIEMFLKFLQDMF